MGVRRNARGSDSKRRFSRQAGRTRNNDIRYDQTITPDEAETSISTFYKVPPVGFEPTLRGF
jgi:hypothetical protein